MSNLTALGTIACMMLAAMAGCAPAGRLTEEQVLAVAEPAMRATFPQDFEIHRPYHAELRDGSWWVHGTLRANAVGGTAEAFVQDGSGKILRVWHTQ